MRETVRQPTNTATRIHDDRRLWRTMLAVLAPVAWVALALSNAVTPQQLGGTTRNSFDSVAAHPTAARAALWLSFAFALTVVPSGVAMMLAYRRAAPRFTTIVGGFVTLAFCAALSNPNTDLMAAVTAEHSLDRAGAMTLTDAVTNHPITNLAIVPFFLTITIGRIALGIMLWRTPLAPRWMAISMLAASPVEFLLQGGPFGSNFAPTAAYVLTAIGFASATVALLRTSDDEFDLPPLQPISDTARMPISRAAGNTDPRHRSGEPGRIRGTHRATTPLLLATILIAAGALSSCGSNHERLSAAQFEDQANAICTEHRAEIGAAAGEALSTENPAPEQLQAAFDKVLGVSRQMFDEIDDLSPPSNLQSAVDTMLTEARRAANAAQAQGSAYWDTQQDPWAQTQQMANDLHLDACAQ